MRESLLRLEVKGLQGSREIESYGFLETYFGRGLKRESEILC